MNSLSKILKISVLAFVASLPIAAQAQTINVAIVVQEPTCFGWTNSKTAATPTGGTAPYTYMWSNGQGGGDTLQGVAAGNYAVTVTDAASRQAVKSFTIGQPPLLIPAVILSGSACDVTTTYTGSGTGGIPPYTYSWRNLGTNAITGSATLTFTTLGTYHLSVTDSRGCTMTKVQEVKPLKLMVITKNVTCAGTGDGSAEAWTDGGAGPYTYVWSTGARTGIIFPLPGGTYSVTVTDANGCVKVATGTVLEPGIITPNLNVSSGCTPPNAQRGITASRCHCRASCYSTSARYV